MPCAVSFRAVDKVGIVNVLAGQGYSETSCCFRGLAWAVYGSVISYIHTRKESYLNVAKKQLIFY